MKKLFSDENVRNSGLKIVSSHVSCPKDKSTDHKGFFIVEADSPATVKVLWFNRCRRKTSRTLWVKSRRPCRRLMQANVTSFLISASYLTR
jgi:hypothetical protein